MPVARGQILVKHGRRGGHAGGAEIERIGKAEAARGPPARPEKRKERAQFVFRADAGADIEAQPRVRPQAAPPFMARGGYGNRGGKFRHHRRIAAQRQRIEHIVKGLHRILVSWGQARVSVACDLRQRPDETLRDPALLRLVESGIDPRPEAFGIRRVEHETCQIILPFNGIAKPLLQGFISGAALPVGTGG